MPENRDEMTLLDYWLIIYLRKRTVLLITFIALLSAWALSTFFRPTFEAKTVFFIPAKLDTLAFHNPNQSDEIIRKPLLPAISEDLHAPYLGLFESNGLIELVSQKVNKDPESLKTDTDFRLNNEFLLEVYARDKDPQQAALIANTYPQVLDEFINTLSANPISEKKKEIENEVILTEKKLKEAEMQLRSFQKEKRSSSVGLGLAELENAKTSFELEMESTQIALDGLNARQSKLEELLSKEAKILVQSPLLISNPLIMEKQKRLSDIEAAIAAMKIELREDHPEIQKLKAQYANVKEDMEKNLGEIIKSSTKGPNTYHEELRHQLIANVLEKQALEAKKSGLASASQSLEKKIQSLLDSKDGLDSLLEDVALYRKTLNSLRIQLEEIDAQKNRALKNVVLVSPAKVPEKPAFPVLWLNLLISGVSGLILGIFYCFFLNYVGEVKNPERRWE